MPILLMRTRFAIAVLAAAMLAVPAANAPLAAAGTRQVSVDSLINDLKHPYALRSQAADPLQPLAAVAEVNVRIWPPAVTRIVRLRSS